MPQQHKQRGQALVLVAIIFPVLAALAFSAIWVGHQAWQQEVVEDALRNATRSAVQTFQYAEFADGGMQVRPVDVTAIGKANFKTNLENAPGLITTPEQAAALVQWTVVYDPNATVCRDLRGREVRFTTPAVCASVTLEMESILPWKNSYQASVFAADTLDLIE